MRPARPLLVVVFAAAALLALAGARVGPAEAVPTELFFSEYVEGTSNNKALEIFNGTGAPVNLTAGGYVVSMYFNGATTPGTDRQLERHHRARRRLRACADLRRIIILDQADQTSSASWYNGDDAVALRKGTAAGITTVDVIGQIGVRSRHRVGHGTDQHRRQHARRKPSIQAGDTNGVDDFRSVDRVGRLRDRHVRRSRLPLDHNRRRHRTDSVVDEPGERRS